MPKLMWLFIIPFLSALLIFSLSALSAKNLKRLAVGLSLLPLAFLLSGPTSWLGTDANHEWIPNLGIRFHLHVDSLSLLFLYLVAVIVPISLLAMSSAQVPSPNVFYGLILLLQGLLIGFFTAKDLAVFTIFWESILLPLYFLINMRDGKEQQAASLKFLTYMIAGSTLMVAAVLALYFASAANGTATFNLDILKNVSQQMPYAAWICAIFLLAFAVKTPLFPFHAWLPDTYYYAPTTATILLSAILSKAGIYGFLRIGLELFPTFMQAWSPLLLGLAIAGVLYGGLTAWMQSDFKRLIAYSSFSHVNFVLAGLFIWYQVAHSGAILQALNHSVTITALFLVAGWLEKRLGTTSMDRTGGVAKFFPHLCWLTLFFVLSSVALPGLNNFVGEFLILFGVFLDNPWLAALLGLTVIISVLYMLCWMQRVYFGEPHAVKGTGADIKGREILIALPLIFLILWIGIYPSPVLKQIGLATEKIAEIPRAEGNS